MTGAEKKAFTDLMAFWGIMIDELNETAMYFDSMKLNKQFYRRNYIRNLFSIIEAYLFITKELIILRVSTLDNHSLTWEELLALKAEKPALDGKTGKPYVKASEYFHFKPNIKFTLNLVAKVFDAEAPGFGVVGFQKLIDLVDRRNHIMHPKSPNEFIVTDEEIKDSVPMLAWFMNTHGTICQAPAFRSWLLEIKNS